MNGHGTTKAARIAGPTLAVLLAVTGTAIPAEAATANAGATWSQLMRRKLTMESEATRLTGLLPSLRTAITTRDGELAQARTTQTTAAKTLAAAHTAADDARARHTAANAAVTAAKKALAAAQKQRPRTESRIAKAKQALTAAQEAARTRATRVGQAASAVKDAQSGYAKATGRVASATTAYDASTKAVADTQRKITSMRAQAPALGTEAAGISQQVVTQTRPIFKIENTTKVYGVTVNKIVAYPFQRMLDDAAKAGIKLSGGGFRTKQQQIALRIANGCPDIWTAPASSCRVPTAIPGRSLHEIGLAIDVTSGGRSLTDRKGAPFKWLAANAARYGFVNLPAEPWHWSITGG